MLFLALALMLILMLRAVILAPVLSLILVLVFVLSSLVKSGFIHAGFSYNRHLTWGEFYSALSIICR